MDAPGIFLWDWNGTLVNDVALCSQLLNSQLQRHGHAPLGGVEEYRRVFRFPIEEYYKDAGFDFARCSYRQLAAEYMQLYPARLLECPATGGAFGFRTGHAGRTACPLRPYGVF